MTRSICADCSSGCARWACRSRSTTSAPATPRWRICATCRSTRSRSTPASSARWSMPRDRRGDDRAGARPERCRGGRRRGERPPARARCASHHDRGLRLPAGAPGCRLTRWPRACRAPARRVNAPTRRRAPVGGGRASRSEQVAGLVAGFPYQSCPFEPSAQLPPHPAPRTLARFAGSCHCVEPGHRRAATTR